MSPVEEVEGEQSNLTQEVLLHRITRRIRQSLELEEILNATVAEVRMYLGSDRVKIYQFHPDGHGFVIAESRDADRLPSLLGLHFPADDIPPYARELFVRARQRSVVDLSNHAVGISPLDCFQTGATLDAVDIRYRPVDPCHVEYLTAMGVQSSVVVPIVLENQSPTRPTLPSLRSPEQLWGLLVSHHSEARVVTDLELQLIQSVVDQLTIAISQSILLNRVRAQAHQEACINQITARLYSQPTVHLQGALDQVVAEFSGSGGRLYLIAPNLSQRVEIYTNGAQPDRLDHGQGRPIEEHRLWSRYLYSVTTGNNDLLGTRLWSVEWMRAVYDLAVPSLDSNTYADAWAVPDLYKEPLFRAITPSFQSTPIRGLLIVPLRTGSEVVGCLTIFRDEVNTEMLWAGCHDTDNRQLMPRQSFRAWRQIKTGQAQQWTDSEIKLALMLGDRLSCAVKQYRLYQQVKALNANLETQVHERTEELSGTLEHLKQAQTHLIQSEKMSSLGQLVAGVAHEINNPVGFIYGNITHIHEYTQNLLSCLRLYQKHYPDPAAEIQQEIQRSDLDFIAGDLPKLLSSLKLGTDRIREIVLSLRNFSRLDHAEVKPVDIHEGIDSTLLILQHRLQAVPPYTGIDIIKRYGELPLVECYVGQLNQVFMNLLANAIDVLEEIQLKESANSTMPLDATITITTKMLDAEWVQISIKDNGPGIPEGIKAKLFDPFFTTKTVGKGTGLGLSISYQIIEKHQGKIECRSVAGQGTAFVIQLPIQQSRSYG